MNSTKTCEAKTSKKAWDNPNAPHARCKMEARTVNKEGFSVCAKHEKSARFGFILTCCSSIFYTCSCEKKEAVK